MREFVRSVIAALSIACLGTAMAAIPSDSALAQARSAPSGKMAPAEEDAPTKQIALTEKQIQGVIAAQPEMDKITDEIDEDAKPDPKLDRQLEAIAKRSGFASMDDYDTVVDNIQMVLGGIDPETKKYVGTEAVIKAKIAETQADKKMSAREKRKTLADLNDDLKSPMPAIENKGNIDLVVRYYDKLSELLDDDEDD
jgi:hypothetical protein